MTKDGFNAIKQRCNNTTQGPWIVVGPFVETEYGWEIDINSHCYGVISEAGESIADATTRNSATLSFGDAEFIAHARDDIPKLIAEIELLQRT